MSPLLWFLAAGVAGALVLWAYGGREERVQGRLGPAALRAVVLFLVFGGLALPALRGDVARPPQRVVLLDLSRSMALPVRAGAPDAPRRIDSALVELARLRPDRVYGFGTEPVPLPLDSLAGPSPVADRTRLRPALEAARLGGADSVWVLSDGAWEDRAEAVDAARGLGLGLKEIRLGEPVGRIGIAGARAPERARAGDTVRVTAELRAAGAALGDSVTVDLRVDSALVARARVEPPSAGRAVDVELAFVPDDPGDASAWRRYEVSLEEGADPHGVSDRATGWIEISDSATGAVLVSTVADWEARFLLPALERLVLGGARGFLRLRGGRWLELSARPRVVEEDVVSRSLRGARLLVVQAAPADIPEWLGRALAAHPRTLVLPRGPGDIPGIGVRVSGPVSGEWYAMPPIPASPAAALLTDVALEPLPPVRELYAVDPAGRWTILNAYRNRRGEARPLLVVGEGEETRWAVSPAAEWWRWALRGGEHRRVYDGILAGVVGWLVEDATSEPVALAAAPAAGRPLEWRIRPGTTGLSVRVTDDAGAEVWSETRDEPAPRLTGPVLPPGAYEISIAARGPDGPFEVERPLEIASDPGELLPTADAPLADIPAVVRERRPLESRMPRPIWPFALAVALLCVEWGWRHRIGLR